jgi:hypothetical protein
LNPSAASDSTTFTTRVVLPLPGLPVTKILLGIAHLAIDPPGYITAVSILLPSYYIHAFKNNERHGIPRLFISDIRYVYPYRIYYQAFSLEANSL